MEKENILLKKSNEAFMSHFSFGKNEVRLHTGPAQEPVPGIAIQYFGPAEFQGRRQCRIKVSDHAAVNLNVGYVKDYQVGATIVSLKPTACDPDGGNFEIEVLPSHATPRS